jgi:hypothetical protein
MSKRIASKAKAKRALRKGHKTMYKPVTCKRPVAKKGAWAPSQLTFKTRYEAEKKQGALSRLGRLGGRRVKKLDNGKYALVERPKNQQGMYFR